MQTNRLREVRFIKFFSQPKKKWCSHGKIVILRWEWESFRNRSSAFDVCQITLCTVVRGLFQILDANDTVKKKAIHFARCISSESRKRDGQMIVWRKASWWWASMRGHFRHALNKMEYPAHFAPFTLGANEHTKDQDEPNAFVHYI